MSLVATSWTTTRVAPTKSAPFAELPCPFAGEELPASGAALSKKSFFLGNALLAVSGLCLLLLFLNPPDRGVSGYRWP